jgi:chemotaxis protein methyltransferase CheR
MGGWTDPAYEGVARIVAATSGLTFKASSCAGAEAATRRAMERAGVQEVGDYLRRLETGQVAVADLVDEVAVCETYFFRQPAQFDFIRSHVLPDIWRRRGRAHRVRAWSAGCASGEEAYSLAIVFEEMGVAEDAIILGTDISRTALERARAAAYGSRSLRGVEEAAVRRHFVRVGYHEILDDRIRRRVVFSRLNLATGGYPSLATHTWSMDLILCRNVLIYFDEATVAQVARRLHAALAGGGWIMTGATDPPLDAFAPFAAVITDRGVFYRRDRGRRSRATLPVADGDPAAETLPLAGALCRLGCGPAN